MTLEGDLARTDDILLALKIADAVWDVLSPVDIPLSNVAGHVDHHQVP